MEIKIRRLPSNIKLALALAVVFVTLCMCCSYVESRPTRTSLPEIFPKLIVPSHFFDDYTDYPEIQLVPQGPRRRRWAFPVDVQETRCPVGQKLHSSGYGCVPDSEGDDY